MIDMKYGIIIVENIVIGIGFIEWLFASIKNTVNSGRNNCTSLDHMWQAILVVVYNSLRIKIDFSWVPQNPIDDYLS